MKTTLRVLAAMVLLLLNRSVFAQQLRLGDNPYSVEKSAVLELSSNNQGLLLPRINDTTAINLLNPPDGMVIYFTPDKHLLLRSNGYWKELTVLGVTSINGTGGAITMDTTYIANFYSKVRSLFSATSPITYSNGIIGIGQATTSTNGYLSSADWNVFNNKQAAGNYVTDPGGNGIIVRTSLNTSTNRTLTGTANRITITNGDGTAGNPTVDISSSYVGQNTITTLGTIGVGTWNGTKISEAYGGTNQTTYTIGDILYSSATNTLSKLGGNTTTTKKFLSQTGNGTNSAAPSWNTLIASDIPDLSGTYATASNTMTFTNKTLTSSTNVLGGVTMSLGSDATGDIYYTQAGGTMKNLPIGAGATVGSPAQVLVSGTTPSWADNTGAWTEYQVSSSDYTTTSTSLGNVTGLVTGTLSTSSMYEFEAVLLTSCSGTGGSKFGTNVTVAPTNTSADYQGMTAAGTGALSATTANNAADGTAFGTAGASTLYCMKIVGIFTTASTGSPVFSIKALSVTSGQTTTVKIGSILRIRKL